MPDYTKLDIPEIEIACDEILLDSARRHAAAWTTFAFWLEFEIAKGYAAFGCPDMQTYWEHLLRNAESETYEDQVEEMKHFAECPVARWGL